MSTRVGCSIDRKTMERIDRREGTAQENMEIAAALLRASNEAAREVARQARINGGKERKG